MVKMLAEALERANDRYVRPGAVGYITAMNEASDSLVERFLPDARIEDHINRYVRD